MKRLLKTIVSLFSVVPVYWCLIFFGILSVVLSIIFRFEVPASGSILVFCSIFAELYFRSEEWIYISYKDQYFAKSHMMDEGKSQRGRQHALELFDLDNNSNQGNYVHILKTRTKNLQKLSDSYNSKGHWNFNSAVSRITSAISLFSAITAATGTLLWGYGHLIFKCVC